MKRETIEISIDTADKIEHLLKMLSYGPELLSTEWLVVADEMWREIDRKRHDAMGVPYGKDCWQSLFFDISLNLLMLDYEDSNMSVLKAAEIDSKYRYEMMCKYPELPKGKGADGYDYPSIEW